MIWVMLTAGRGPAECQLAVAGLVEALCGEAAASGMDARVLSAEEGAHGLLSAMVALDGDGAEAMAASWDGTIRWTCPSPVRRGWPRKNWFCSGSVLRPPEQERGFHAADLRFETLRASGPGGQHVNKTESAVRLTHLPSGLSVLAREERSQHRNKALALARLAGMLAARGRQAEAEGERERWARHDALERGNECRAYDGPGFRRTR